MQTEDQYITSAPKDGVYIKGLFLEASGWDKKNACLIEAEPMQLVCPMPTILFKPVENKKKSTKGIKNIHKKFTFFFYIEAINIIFYLNLRSLCMSMLLLSE